MRDINECLKKCTYEERYNSFTYAKLSHPLSNKRSTCWLKSGSAPEYVVSDIHYISGFK